MNVVRCHLIDIPMSGPHTVERLGTTIFKTLLISLIHTLYNYRLLMRSTHDYEDRVRYWLTDAEGGGQPIPDKVFMVMSRPKSKVYYCFIKLIWNLHFTKIEISIATAFYRAH